MKRPALVVVANVVQTMLGLAMAGMTVYLIILSRSRETLAEVDAADAARGLLIGAVVFAIPAAITLIAALGLWNRKLWGWVLSLATDIGMLAVLIYSMIDDHDIDGEMIALTLGFLVPAVFLLLPQVRKAYWIPRPRAT